MFLRRQKQAGRPLPWVSLFLSGAAVVIYFLPDFTAALEYNRFKVLSFDLWRLFTCHFTHISREHLFYDLLAFACLGIFCESLDKKAFLWCLTITCLAVSFAVLILQPGLIHYRGLSGLDSALFCLLALLLLKDRLQNKAWKSCVLLGLVMVLFVLKIVWESLNPSFLFVSNEQVIPVPLAHGIGALTGTLCAVWPNKHTPDPLVFESAPNP